MKHHSIIACGFETDCTKHFQFVGTKLQWKKSTRIPDRKSSHGVSMEVDVKKVQAGSYFENLHKSG